MTLSTRRGEDEDEDEDEREDEAPAAAPSSVLRLLLLLPTGRDTPPSLSPLRPPSTHHLHPVSRQPRLSFKIMMGTRSPTGKATSQRRQRGKEERERKKRQMMEDVTVVESED